MRPLSNHSSRRRITAAALAGAALFVAGPAAAVTYTFSGGLYQPGVTSPNPLLSPDVLEIVGGANKTFGSSDFTNQSGTVNWFDGTIFLSGGSADVSNQSVWNMLGNNVMTFSNGGGTFTNSGTLAKTGGGGTSTIGVPFFNSGTIDVQTGTVLMNGGSTFSAGSVFTGAGIAQLGGNGTFNGSFTTGNLDFAGSNYTGVGAVLNGSADFIGGSFNGGWTVANGSSLTITGGANKSFGGGTFTNDGTVNWTDATLFLSGGGANVVNNGDWNSSADTVMTFSNGGGSFTNNGTLTKTAGAGATTIQPTFVNNGTIDAQSGTLRLDGVITINAGSDFTGAGIVAIANSATFNGAFTSSNLDFVGGNYTGNVASLVGTADFRAGAFAGTWTVDAGSTLTIQGASNKSFSPGTFTNNGTVNWNDATLFLSGGGADVVNNGAWNSSADTVLTFSNGGGTFTNNGTLAKTAGAGATTIQPAFVNNGTIDAQTGTVLLNGGPITINAGSSFIGAGDVNIGSSATFDGAFSSTNLNFVGGNFTGVGAALNGSADYSSGAFGGTWTVTNGSTFSIVGGANKSFSGSFTNEGTVAWTDATLFLTGGASWVNNGTLTATADNVLTISSGGGTLTNSGLIQKTAGAGTTSLSTIGLTNTGTISSQSGTIALPTNFTNAGTLTGSSLFSVSGTLTNNGTVAPGAGGVGALGLTGNYVQTAAGTLAIQLGGGTADLFNMTGAASLNGTLALFCANCSLSAGETFTILDSTGDLSGSFANVTASGFLAGFAYDVIYDTALDQVRLQVTNPGMAPPTGVVPEPQSWAMLILGFGLVGGAVRRRQAGRFAHA